MQKKYNSKLKVIHQLPVAHMATPRKIKALRDDRLCDRVGICGTIGLLAIVLLAGALLFFEAIAHNIIRMF